VWAIYPRVDQVFAPLVADQERYNLLKGE